MSLAKNKQLIKLVLGLVTYIQIIDIRKKLQF